MIDSTIYKSPDAPDFPARWAPNSDCLDLFFEKEADAYTYLSRQRQLAEARDDRVVGMVFKDSCINKGSFNARLWYGPFYVWFEHEDYYGFGEASFKEGTNYTIRQGYPHNTDGLITVPIANAEPIKDLQARLGKKMPEEMRRAIENHTCFKKQPPPPPPPPPVQTTRAQKPKTVWSKL